MTSTIWKPEVFTHGRAYSPTTNWLQGGPIIDREGIPTSMLRTDSGREWRSVGWVGATWLVAGLRCYVASRLGQEVEVPDGLA